MPTPTLLLALDVTPLLGTRTGVASYVEGVVSALAAAGELDLSAFAVSWRGRHHLSGGLPAGVRAVARPMAARPLHVAWRHLDAPPIEWWTGPVDVVHGTNFVVPPARRAARVVTVHDLTAWRYPELCTPHTLHYPRLVARAWEAGAWVHAPSAFVAAELADVLPGSSERIVAVHSGVPAAAGGDAAAGCRLAGADRYVLSIGTVEPRKDLPTLVRAFDTAAADSADLHLVVAGPDGWGAEALGAAIEAARHRDRIHRLGFVPPDVRADLLAGAAVFAYPSIYEGFGFPPLEAMTAGAPVVATRTGPLPEILGDAALLVPVGDAEALADALIRAATDPATRERLVADGGERARRYSWEKCAAGLTALYRRAAEER